MRWPQSTMNKRINPAKQGEKNDASLYGLTSEHKRKCKNGKKYEDASIGEQVWAAKDE